MKTTWTWIGLLGLLLGTVGSAWPASPYLPFWSKSSVAKADAKADHGAVEEQANAPEAAPEPAVEPPAVEGLTGAGPADADCCRRHCALYGRVDYLLWWIEDGPLGFPLVTTGDPADPVSPGALGRPGTVPLFGGEGLDYGAFSGVRLTLGAWVNAAQTCAVEVSGFLLEKRSVGFAAGSDAAGNPPLFVPVFRADLGREGQFTISTPGGGAPLLGSIAIASHTRLGGLEVNGVGEVTHSDNFMLLVLGGLRYLDLNEDLVLSAPNLVDPGLGINDSIEDRFTTRNQFYAVQVGAQATYRYERVTAGLIGKLAVGNNRQLVDIQGSTTETGAGAPVAGTFPGGILTQPTNIGHFRRSEFNVIPELELQLGVDLTGSLRLSAGYNFLYWGQVVRPGNQIDRVVNQTQSLGGVLVGPARPLPLFDRSDFWAQGVNLGLEYRY